jgi:LuxR family maltose regulon positive regulatory protein
MKNEVPAQFLATKTTRPRRPPGLIDRLRLLEELNQGQTRRLIIIKGAAGFGKTSLAITWAERLQAQGHGVAWLSLDAEDDEPTQFLFYVAHVLRAVCDGVGKPALDLIEEIMLVRPLTIVRSLINSLAELEDDVFLFLDDYHVLTHPGIHEGIAYLLRHAPSNLHLVLTTRTEPELPLGRWRAQNQLLEIDGAALRFDLEETRHFLEQELPAKLGQDETRELHAKTEGWPAMLRIVATASVQSGQALSQYVDNLSGKIRPIRSYITEMLDGLPAPLLGFLLRAAILDRLCAPLCQAVTGLAGSQELLEDIATRRLLLIPLDQDGTWFRCHPLLRGFLLQRLEAELGAEIPELHRRAYAWYAGAELWTDAIQHAIAAGDTAQTIGWVEKCAMALIKRGELLTLLTWARLMPPAVMKRQVKVRLAIAWGLALAMRFDEALDLATEIERELKGGEARVVEFLGCECLTIRAVALALRDDTAAALQLAEESLRRNSSGRWTSNVAANVALLGYWKLGDLARYHGVPWIASSGEDGSRNVVATVYRLCLQGLVEYEQLRTSSAARHYHKALQVAQDHAGAKSVAAAMPASLLAQLHYDQGQLDEAEELVINRLGAIDAACMLECVLRAYLVLVRVAMNRGHTERAHALLDQAESLGKARHWGRLVASIMLERVRINLGEGRAVQAEVTVAQLDRLALDYPAPVRCAWSEIQDHAAMARVELLSAKKRYPQGIAVLRQLLQEARTAECDDQALHLTIRLAAEFCRAQELDEAAALLCDAIPVAAASGIIQPFLDAAPGIIPLLPRVQDELQRRGAAADAVSFIASLLSNHQGTEMPPQALASAAESAERLSPRELGVLTLLVKGQSNKDIARGLSIAPETVKSHLKNIFAKLGVACRAQAVSRALSLGLVNAS